MPWYVPWSENIKKRACRYLLQRYLGQFLEEKLTLDQLSIDLYNGTGTVCDVSLDCESLNELGEAQGWPIEFVDGFVQKVDVSIPWANILRDDSFVQVSGLSITIQPRQRTQSGTGMLESMWSSMTSSMQLATECLQQQENEGEGPAVPQPVEGIELFAQTIDSILCRVKVRFSNTTIRMEHVPKDSSTGVALEIHIKNIDYLDEAGSDPPTQLSEAEKNKTYVVSTFTTKKICFEGVTFHTDEFPSKARTFSRSIVVESSHTPLNTNQDNILDHLCKDFNSDPVESLYESCTIGTSSYISSNETSNKYETPSTGTSTELPNISNVCTEPEPILCARLAGRQEMRIRIKQSEEALGPKVDFQLTLGSLAVFLSPRQFHILIELAEGLASPHLEDNSNMPCRSRGAECKPMRAMDFERVEAQLAGEIQGGGHHNMQHLLHTHGWSYNNMGDSLNDDEEKFLPLRKEAPPQADSLSSSLTSSMISNASSLPSLASTNTHQRKKRGSTSISEGDLQVEVSQVHIRIASLACVLLHEDILTLSASTNGECLAASSVKQMKSISEEFFTKLGLFTVSGYGSRDLDEASKAFDEAVGSNHIRLILAPLVVEGSERCNGSNSCLSVQLTAARLQLNECLREDASLPQSHGQRKFTTVPLLTFTAQDSDGAGESSLLNPLCKTPDMKIYYKSTQRTSRDRKYSNPKIDVSINLEPCTIEVDISLMDRMCAVLSPQPLCRRREGPLVMGERPTVSLQDQQASMQDNNYQVRVMCPRATVRLRFPIADLRPAHDMSRPAWWQRCVRKELLVGHLMQATLTLQPTNIDIKCREMNLYFSTDGSGGGDIHLGSAIADEEMTHGDDSSLPTLAWPSLSISWMEDEKSPSGLLDSCSDGEGDQVSGVMGQSSGMLMDALGLRPGPFSSKKMVHESDTPHPKDDKDDTEELVIPGDAKEMKQFMEYSMKNSLLQIQCNLPVVSLQLDGKQLYELLYNRINSDLFLWEPCAPRPAVQPVTPHMPHHFTMCKSAINYNSDSDSTTSSSTDSNNLYYSTYDHKGRQPNKTKARQNADTRERVGRINLTCFNLQIGKGLLTVYTPVRDSSNLVIPGQRGEMCVRVGALSMCHVAGIAGNPRRALLSLQATNAQLYHAGVVSCPDQPSPLRLYSASVPSHMRLTIQPSDKGVQLKQPPTSSRDQLSLAISIRPHKDYHHFKTIRVAVGVSNSTLNFAVCPAQHSVLNQIIDMFDVLDYPVPGYEPSTVITELHVHVWDCAVDYRPLKLPLRTIVTLGSFSVSSNVVAQSNASNLRFMAEECMLFIADGSSSGPANLRKDYVQVLDLGLFELSLRVNDKHISTAPRMDLRASNNVVHIRTCSDTFSALCRLINYLAGDGDLLDQHAESTHSVGDQTSDNIIFGDDSSSGIQQEDIRELSKSQVQQVNDLMADAMEEQPKPDDGNVEDETEPTREGVEVFFFPDESKAAKLERESSSLTHASINSSATDLTGNNFADCEPTSGEFLSDDAVNNLKPEGRERLISFGDEMGPPIPVVARELGDYSVKTDDEKPVRHETAKKPDRKSSGDTDDEFCMLGDEILAAGSRGVTEPQVKWLVEGPPHVVDGHFSIPQGKSDILKPPKNFPMALFRYTLREMTVIWHMYGGRDFPMPQSPSHKRDDHRSTSLGPTTKHVTISTQSPTFTHRERDPYSVIPQSPSSWTGTVSYSKSGTGESVSVGTSGGKGRGKAWTLMGGAGRRHDMLMELQLNKVRFLHETYPPGYSESSRQVLAISSVEVRDRLASSQINKFLYQYTSEQRPKREHANMVVVKAVHVRPEGSSSPPECCLKVSLLPLRFNIDQDALLFLISFFTQLSDVEQSKEGSLSSAQSGSSQSLHSLGGGSPRHPPAPPVMGVTPRDTDSDIEDSLSLKDDDEGNPLMRSYEAERLVSENLILLEEDWKGGPGPSRKGSIHSHRGSITASQPSSTPEPDDAPVYFRNVVFSPEVPIRLDYQGKRVDLTHGPLAGLLMGLAQLNCSELKLKRLSYRLGLLGMEKLIRWALQEWLGDIKRRQLPGLLGGVGPMYSLLQLFQGIRDLFWLPIEQYQRDGRLVRGLQRGASSFTTSTAMAALDITARIVYLIQATAETAYDMVSPSPGLRSVRRRRRRDRAGQPQDIREGVSTAYTIVKEGLNETAMALAEVAVSECAVRGYSGAVGGVLRQLPPTALAPLLLASAAANRLLGGVRASLQPPHHQEHSDKWRTNSD